MLFLDVETTGLNPDIHAVHQISGIIYIDGEKKEEFDFNVRPHAGALADKKALEIAGVTKDQLRGYESNIDVYQKIKTILEKYVDKFDKKDKFFFCAYNANFDNSFMWSFLQNAGDNYWGSYVWSGSLDIMALAAFHLTEQRAEMPNFKLMTVALELGIEIDESKLHNSLYDVELTYEIYKKINLKN